MFPDPDRLYDPDFAPPRMDEHRLRRLLEGDGSALSALSRMALYIPGKAYGLAMTLRRSAYQKGYIPTSHAGLPTISVGNLTAGGSGKTPTVALLASKLLILGHLPAILMRGYSKSPDKASDEAELYRSLVPEAIIAVDANRRRGAARAAEAGATVLLMDDGFQHLKLRRDLDIVLVDATSPWGGGNTLPGGLLREPRSALRRAGVVVVTRSDQATPEKVQNIIAEIGRLAPKAFVTTAKHYPNQLYSLTGGALPLATLNGKNVVILAGIARPEAFEKTLVKLGAQPVAMFAKSDHHPMSPDYILAAVETARDLDAVVVTTEKDRAKTVFQELCGERADNIDSNMREALHHILVLGVRQKIRDLEQFMRLVVRVAPTGRNDNTERIMESEM